MSIKISPCFIRLPFEGKKISPNVQLFVEEKCEDIYSIGYICKLFIFRLIDFTWTWFRQHKWKYWQDSVFLRNRFMSFLTTSIPKCQVYMSHKCTILAQTCSRLEQTCSGIHWICFFLVGDWSHFLLVKISYRLTCASPRKSCLVNFILVLAIFVIFNDLPYYDPSIQFWLSLPHANRNQMTPSRPDWDCSSSSLFVL